MVSGGGRTSRSCSSRQTSNRHDLDDALPSLDAEAFSPTGLDIFCCSRQFKVAAAVVRPEEGFWDGFSRRCCCCGGDADQGRPRQPGRDGPRCVLF